MHFPVLGSQVPEGHDTPAQGSATHWPAAHCQPWGHWKTPSAHVLGESTQWPVVGSRAAPLGHAGTAGITQSPPRQVHPGGHDPPVAQETDSDTQVSESKSYVEPSGQAGFAGITQSL